MLSVYIPLIAFSILSISGPKWLPSLYYYLRGIKYLIAPSASISSIFL